MPRPRKKLQGPRPACDCLECRQGAAPISGVPAAATAAARQQPPPKCLVLVVEGALAATGGGEGSEWEPPVAGMPGRARWRRSTLEDADTPHIDAMARLGSSGLLAVREQGAAGDSLAAQLLTYGREHVAMARGEGGEGGWEAVGERFRGFRSLSAAACSTSGAVARTARLAGFAAAAECLLPDGDAPQGAAILPPPERFAARAAAAMGFASGARFLEAPGELGMFSGSARGDLLFAHVGRGARPPGGGPGGGGAVALLEWADAALRHLMGVPGVREEAVLCLVLGQDEGRPCLGLPAGGGGGAGRAYRPVQSFERVGGGDPAGPFREGDTALAVQRLPGVVRVDACAGAGLEEATARGGMGCLLAEHVLPEVAYKMGCTHKYGQ